MSSVGTVFLRETLFQLSPVCSSVPLSNQPLSTEDFSGSDHLARPVIGHKGASKKSPSAHSGWAERKEISSGRWPTIPYDVSFLIDSQLLSSNFSSRRSNDIAAVYTFPLTTPEMSGFADDLNKTTDKWGEKRGLPLTKAPGREGFPVLSAQKHGFAFPFYLPHFPVWAREKRKKLLAPVAANNRTRGIFRAVFLGQEVV